MSNSDPMSNSDAASKADAKSKSDAASKADPMSKSDAAGKSGPAGRRALAYAVLLCLAGAGLALYAATRTWHVEVTVRPAPLPELRTPRRGASWLAPIAVVGLAAAGALVATRGLARRAVGILLILVGAGLAVGGGQGLADSRLWPALCLIGGVAVAVAGGLTVARGQTWPAMGARYERGDGRRSSTEPVATGARGAPSDRPVPAAEDGSVASTQAWDALDRGEDPTLQ